jgi:hypothetical protein
VLLTSIHGRKDTPRFTGTHSRNRCNGPHTRGSAWYSNTNSLVGCPSKQETNALERWKFTACCLPRTAYVRYSPFSKTIWTVIIGLPLQHKSVSSVYSTTCSHCIISLQSVKLANPGFWSFETIIYNYRLARMLNTYSHYEIALCELLPGT